MTNWQECDGYLKELKKLSKTFPTIYSDIDKIKRLLDAHFFGETTRGSVIAPGKIHRVSQEDDIAQIELWKVEVSVPNLKPNLWPRLWFMIDGNSIIFLAIASHKDNYDNNEMDRLAKKRYNGLLDS